MFVAAHSSAPGSPPAAAGPPLHRWEPATTPRAALLVLHGYLEHGGRYAELGEALAQRGIITVAIDLRGHGRAPGVRGLIDRFDDYVDDARGGLRALPAGVPHFVLGHSNGGLVALLLAQRSGQALAGLILTNPFLAQTQPAPRWKRALGLVAGRLWPRLALPAGIRAEDLSHDLQQQAAHAADPLIQTHATAGWFVAVRRVQAELQALRLLPLPLLFVFSDADPVASPAHSAALAARLQSPDKTVICRADARHEVLMERDREALFEVVANWLLARSSGPAGSA